ncbi:hypothetical protein HYY75_07165 [bacterium]|nr:hypothetical protein [bacterium]
MIRESEELASLLGHKGLKVWNGDPGIVFEDTAGYAQLLRSLSSISRGLFLVHNINEIWHRGKGSVIQLSFVFQNIPRKIFIPRTNEFLDFRFLYFVNRLLEKSGFYFALQGNPEDPLLVFLSSEGESCIKHVLHWEFRVFSPPEIAQFILAPIERRLELKDFDGIIEDMDAAIKTLSSDPMFFLYRGIAQYYLGNKQSAQSDWVYCVNIGLTNVNELVRRRFGASALK